LTSKLSINWPTPMPIEKRKKTGSRNPVRKSFHACR
jgi:hypothetical protein